MNFFKRLFGGLRNELTATNAANDVKGAFAAAMLHSTSFRLGRFQITASSGDATSGNPSQPVHFTFAAAMLGIEMALAGQTGVFQSGVITVMVGQFPATMPAQ